MTEPAARPAALPLLSSGFEYRRMDVAGVTINFAVGGAGAPLLLLHGYPQNHLMWRRVAPALAHRPLPAGRSTGPGDRRAA